MEQSQMNNPTLLNIPPEPQVTEAPTLEKRKGGWPLGKPRPRKETNEFVQEGNPPTNVVITQQTNNSGLMPLIWTDPQLDKRLFAIKREELLSYFASNQRAHGKDRQAIIEAWTILKSTLTPSNIDLLVAEEKLKAIVAQNRATLGYDKADIEKMIVMAINEVKS